MKATKQSRRVAREVFEFNQDNPVGTAVRYWPGAREGEGRLSKTRAIAHSLEGHTAVVWVEGHAGCIALSHVQPIEKPIDVMIASAKAHMQWMKAGRA